MTTQRRWLIGGGGLLVVLLFLLLAPAGSAISQDVTRVLIANWPTAQEVYGKVSIDGPVRVEPTEGWKIHATLVRMENILVSPVRPDQTTRLVDAGVLTTDGYPYVVLSLAGQVKGDLTKPGEVGAILIPEEETIQTAFDETGMVIHPLRVSSGQLVESTGFFDSEQPRLAVGFPRYRVLLYNTTDKAVEADLFAYLTSG